MRIRLRSRTLACLFAVLLCVPLLTACPVQLARSDDTITNVLLWIQRADKGVDAASELAHKLHCPKCKTHLLSADAEIAWQERFLLANDWLTKAFTAIDTARGATNALRLTTALRSDLDTYLNGVAGALTLTEQDGAPSTAVIAVNALLDPVRKDLDHLRAKFAAVRLVAAGVTVEFTDSELAAIAKAKQANQQARAVLLARTLAQKSGDVEASVKP